MTNRYPRAGRLLGSALVFVMPLISMTVNAEDDFVCVNNRFEVAWAHPGVTLFLEQLSGRCSGEQMVLQDGETGCFNTKQVQHDGSWHLSALDSITAECRSVCPIESAQIKLQFSVNNGYSCEIWLH